MAAAPMTPQATASAVTLFATFFENCFIVKSTSTPALPSMLFAEQIPPSRKAKFVPENTPLLKAPDNKRKVEEMVPAGLLM